MEEEFIIFKAYIYPIFYYGFYYKMANLLAIVLKSETAVTLKEPYPVDLKEEHSIDYGNKDNKGLS